MGDIWQAADNDPVQFATAASLLAIRTFQQSISASSEPHIEQDDDSVDEEVEEDWATTRPTARLNQASRGSMIGKFLNQMAEVFAREKSSAQQSHRTDSKHIAATAWINSDNGSPIIILLAKNEGLDDRDSRMMGRLQSWFRAIAATGRPSPIQTDVLWVGNEAKEGLLEYYRSRLEYYIDQINQQDNHMDALAARAGVYSAVIKCLQSLCKHFEWDSTAHQLSDIVNIAYLIRYRMWHLLGHSKARKELLAVFMLSRLRAAYECFKDTALSFSEFGSMEIKPTLIPHSTEINTMEFQKQLRALVEELKFRKGLIKTKNARKYVGASRLHIHAEMQIFVSLEQNLGWSRRAYRYIGTSRKPCFLCNEFMKNYVKLSMSGIRSPAFNARKSHGKIYPLWTLPALQATASNTVLSIATALIQTRHRVLYLLQEGVERRPAIAESSAGVTHIEAFSGSLGKLKYRHRAAQRNAVSSRTSISGEKPITYGPKMKSVQVGRLPANGKKPELVPINFYALPEETDSRIPEFGHYYVPDFSAYWGACQLDRRFRCLSLENQENKEFEGTYYIYWNKNDELPENELIKKMIGIKHVEFARQFWYGDVFIVRFSEHPTTFAYDVYDAPSEILDHLGVRNLFQDMWDRSFLEDELQSDKFFETAQEKRDADKNIILQRMTPVEREVLNRLPPDTLEALAMTGCDDGAILDYSLEKCPDDPGMVKLNTAELPTALESMGWTGFDSSQL